MSKKRVISLQKKFICLLLCAAFFITISISICIYRESSKVILNSYEQIITDKIELLDTRMEALMNTTERIADTIISENILKSVTTEKENQAIYDAFEKQVELCPEVVNLIFSRDDRVFLFPRNDAVENQVPSTATWYTQRFADTTESNWQDPYIDASTNQWIMTYYKRVYENDKIIGFIEIDISLAHITDLISTIEIGEEGKLYITQDGNIVICEFEDLNGHDIPDLELYEAVATNESGSLGYMSSSEEKFAVYSRLQVTRIGKLSVFFQRVKLLQKSMPY